MTATDDALQRNQQFADQFQNRGLGAAPAKKIAVLACMDARLDPWRVLGLDEGDAHVIRNGGGVVTDDAIRSLSISQYELGTEEIVLIHHTNCGLQTITDEEFAAKLEAETGERPQWRAHAFEDLEEDVREGIRLLEASPFIPNKSSIRGFVYELETGRLREVSPT